MATFLFGGPEENRFSRLDAVRSSRLRQHACAVIHYRSLRSPQEKVKAPQGRFSFGGPEENRTPVRKTIRGAFSERILSFEIPSPQRRQTGFAHR